MIEAVAASIAIPGIISAPKVGGRVLIDGGMTDPVPFDKLPDSCDVKIAVDVTGRPAPAKRGHPTNSQLVYGSILTMFHQIAELRRDRNPPDLYVEPALDDFYGGDFFKIDDILKAAEPARDEVRDYLQGLI